MISFSSEDLSGREVITADDVASFAEAYCTDFNSAVSKEQSLSVSDLTIDQVDVSEQISMSWIPSHGSSYPGAQCLVSCTDIFIAFLNDVTCKETPSQYR